MVAQRTYAPKISANDVKKIADSLDLGAISGRVEFLRRPCTSGGMENHAECTCRLAGAEFRDRVTASRKVLRSAQARNRLPRVYVESDDAAQSIILIHTSVAGKVGPYRRNQKVFPLRSKTGALRLQFWILENHPFSWLINREAKL
jgi:hypothetical protein